MDLLIIPTVPHPAPGPHLSSPSHCPLMTHHTTPPPGETRITSKPHYRQREHPFRAWQKPSHVVLLACKTESCPCLIFWGLNVSEQLCPWRCFLNKSIRGGTAASAKVELGPFHCGPLSVPLSVGRPPLAGRKQQEITSRAENLVHFFCERRHNKCLPLQTCGNGRKTGFLKRTLGHVMVLAGMWKRGKHPSDTDGLFRCLCRPAAKPAVSLGS